MKTLLIATTNKGKFAEMKRFFETLPFTILSLDEIPNTTTPEETGATLEQNAILKAKHCGDTSGHLTIADDAGLFIDALDQWPGIETARIASYDGEQVPIILEKMKNIANREATFRSCLALYEPSEGIITTVEGVTKGHITTEPRGELISYGANKIFFVDEYKKTYAEMTYDEKNEISHRAKALHKMKYHLQNQYSGRNVIVPLALIVKDHKVLMSLRSDPHRPEFHKVWEFPGGAVEFGEDVTETLKREVKEEIGYEIEIVSHPLQVTTKAKEGKTYKYQVILIPYICKIIGGDGIHSDAEVIETKWFDLEEVPKLHLFDDDDTMIKNLTPTIKQIIEQHNL